MRRAFLALLFASLFLPSTSALAQPYLVVEPDTLIFPDHSPIEAGIEISNSGSNLLQIDSLLFSTVDPRSWHLDLLVSDTTYYALDYFGKLDTNISDPFPELALAPNTTMRLIISPNIATKQGTLGFTSISDTLWIYSNSNLQNPRLIFIGSAIQVSAEDPTQPPGSLSLEAYPNPFRERTTLEIKTPMLHPVDVSIYDLLGQRVYHQQVNGRIVLVQWPTNQTYMPSGTYFVRVSIPNRQTIRATSTWT